MSSPENQCSTPRSDLLKRLVAEVEQGKRIISMYQASRDSSCLRPYEVLASLGITKENLSDLAKEALDAIDEMCSSTEDSEWLNFQWKLSAFLHVQDIFDSVLQPMDDLRVLFQQYYFYFESRVILAESFLAGLNGLYVASDALLRPFLEFTLLQTYYHRLVKKIGTYEAVQRYFTRGRHPSWGTVISKSLPNDSFCKPLRSRIQAALRGLSESSSHPYHPDFSPLQHRSSPHGHSLEGLFFWHKTRMILDIALWIYYVNFPLLFHPVDILRKFGYNSPVGIVVDHYTSELIKHSLTTQDYETFRKYSSEQDVVISILEWVSARPDLTDDQIRATWNTEDGPLGDLWEGYCQHMVKFRAIRMATAFRPSEPQNLPDELTDAIQSLTGWINFEKCVKAIQRSSGSSSRK